MQTKENDIKLKPCGPGDDTAHYNNENISSYQLSLSSLRQGAQRRARSIKSERILQMICITAISFLVYSTFEAEEEPHGRFLESEPHEELPHKDLLPMDSKDVIGFFFATLGLMVAAGGGVGGGGVLVPIYILIMKFKPKHAIPLSNITVFGGAVANTILNARKRHPLADRPVVDWDLILVMEPLAIGGALAGTFLNVLLNEMLFVSMLVLLLSSTACATLKKAIKMYRKESREMMEKESKLTAMVRRVKNKKKNQLLLILQEREQRWLEEEENMEGGEEKKDEQRWLGDEKNKVRNEKLDKILLEIEEQWWLEEEEDIKRGEEKEEQSGLEEEENEVRNEKLDKILQEEREEQRWLGEEKNMEGGEEKKEEPMGLEEEENEARSVELDKILQEEREVPVTNLWILWATFTVVLLVNFAKGGGASSPLGIQCGSISFWVANIFLLSWTIFIMMISRSYLVKRHHVKERVGYPFVEGDIKWDERNTLIYPAVCFVAGLFAGMFGIGGGIIKGPLMLGMGIHPSVVSASCACMILFTSFTATTSFVVFGLLKFDYAFACILLGFSATYIGNVGLTYLMKQYGRSSYIAFSIGGIVLLSAILMTVRSVIAMAEGTESSSDGLCGKD